MSFLEFLLANRGEALTLTLEHLVLVAVAMLIAVVLGVPLGVLSTRRQRLGRWVLGFSNILQTIPSLALFGFLLPVPLVGGIGSRTAIVALALYALLPIVRNTYTGIRDIDPAVIEAARGLGMTDRQLLWQVELPLALGVIVAGIRVATVINVGVATVAAAIGAGGLGVFIFRGLALVDNRVILAGAVPAALLALVADFSLGWAERRLRQAI